MSRSYKKSPFATDHKRGTTKGLKRLANKTFRRRISCDEDMPARPAHRKYTETWDIHDYSWRMTRAEAIDWYLCEAPASFKERFPTLKAWLKYWEKCYRRKQVLKRYLFLCEDFPLGQIQFDEEKGVGTFTYCLTSAASDFINIRPSTIIMLLEEVRDDAAGLKTTGQFYDYIGSNFGKFKFEPLKGYE